MTFTETAVGAALAGLASALLAGLGYIFNLGSRVTALEANTEARHEENIRKITDLQNTVDRIEDFLLNGRRR